MKHSTPSLYALRVSGSALLLSVIAACVLKQETDPGAMSPGIEGASASADSGSTELLVAPADPAYFLGFWYDEAQQKTVRKWMEDRGGYAVIQGDMVLGTVEELSQPGTAKSTFFTNSKLWKYAIVPYILPDDLPGKALVKDAVKHFNDDTDIILRPYKAGDTNWIKFELFPAPQPGKADPFVNVGGDSRYGRNPSGGQQLVRLNRYGKFDSGTVVHELCHALGQGHEQNRQDRDDFVVINKNNIAKNAQGKVPSQTAAQFDILNPGKDFPKYDFDSISHYPPSAFAEAGKKTIEARSGLASSTYVGNPKKFGTRTRLSAGDIQGINEFYKAEIAARPPQ